MGPPSFKKQKFLFLSHCLIIVRLVNYNLYLLAKYQKFRSGDLVTSARIRINTLRFRKRTESRKTEKFKGKKIFLQGTSLSTQKII
jgi:hypothetical protein